MVQRYSKKGKIQRKRAIFFFIQNLLCKFAPNNNANHIMTNLSVLFLFSFRSLLRLDILVWVAGVPLLIFAAIVLYSQFRTYRRLKGEVEQLDKMKLHSVEYDLVLKAMKLAVWRIDVATRTITMEADYRDDSDSFSPPPGISLEELSKYLLPEYRELLLQSASDLLEGRLEMTHLQYQFKLPYTDKTYWSDVFATVDKRDLEGRPISVVGTVMRIDQQKSAERALMDALYHAEESDRLKSAFLANISHEIRTPLNAIVGFSDVLSSVEDATERQELLQLIHQNNNRLLRLFDDVVSMAKLEAQGGGVVKKSTFSLKEVMLQLVDKYQDSAVVSDVPLSIDESEALPRLTTDRDRLREILNQYVNNALKFTTQGQVTMGCSSRGDVWRIWVKDTGIGIPEERCNEQLFERFVKLDEFSSGTGLGLSICRSLAKTIGGTVGLESHEGKGSTFWVELKKESS